MEKRVQRMIKRTWACIGAGLCMLGLPMLTGCAKEGKTPDFETSPVLSSQGEPDIVTLDWYVNFSWYTTPFGENIVSETIREETGVNIRFLAPMGNEREKFDALISSDTLPDIITMGWWEPQLDEMLNRGMVYALNELADEYAPYFWQVADKTVCDWYTKADGNLYCYPNSSFVPEDYETYGIIGSQQTFLVRKDIYEALGCPDMTTPEGFKQAVKDAASLYSEADGAPLIPIGSHIFNNTGCVSFDQYLQNFLAVPFEKNGVYYDRISDPEYIRWLKMFRELGEEGYLLEDIFIDQRIQMQEKLEQGRYFCMIYQRTDIVEQEKLLYAENSERIYIAVDGPKNSKGDAHILPGAGINGWVVNLISKNCEYPERAMELISYLISEQGQKVLFLGVEGETYDMMDGKPVVREEVQKLLHQDRDEYDRLYGADNTYWMLQDNVMQMQWKQEPEYPFSQLEECTYPYTHYLGHYEIDFEANSAEGNADLKIKELWSETLPNLLLAPSEETFDVIFQQFLEKREKLGYHIVIEESTRQMKENKARLGIGAAVR